MVPGSRTEPPGHASPAAAAPGPVHAARRSGTALYDLLEAQRAGYRVDAWRLDRGTRALAALYAAFPRAEPDLRAYIVWVLGRALGRAAAVDWHDGGRSGRFDRAPALDDLWNARERMSAYGRALLLLALDESRDSRGDALAAALRAEASTRGRLAWWTVGRDPLLGDLADTSVEATALAVQALAARDPGDAQLEDAVRWLLLSRRGAGWGSTKQTAMALYGLLEYMRARGEYPAPFTVDVHVNGALVRVHSFTAAALTTADPVVIDAPARRGVNEVRLVKRGGGTLYWSAAVEYYDTAAAARTGTRELAIARRYARLVPVRVADRLVYREVPLDGAVAPGDVLSVRLVVAGSHDWRHLVVEDPRPAGVEAVQDDTAYPLEQPVARASGSRAEHRDEQTVFFQDTLEHGRVEYQYLVRVVAPGRFRARPAQVMPMYVPEAGASSDPFTLLVAPAPGGARP